jgi:hypothetical protein
LALTGCRGTERSPGRQHVELGSSTPSRDKTKQAVLPILGAAPAESIPSLGIALAGSCSGSSRDPALATSVSGQGAGYWPPSPPCWVYLCADSAGRPARERARAPSASLPLGLRTAVASSDCKRRPWRDGSQDRPVRPAHAFPPSFDICEVVLRTPAENNVSPGGLRDGHALGSGPPGRGPERHGPARHDASACGRCAQRGLLFQVARFEHVCVTLPHSGDFCRPRSQTQVGDALDL